MFVFNLEVGKGFNFRTLCPKWDVYLSKVNIRGIMIYFLAMIRVMINTCYRLKYLYISPSFKLFLNII